ncbi:MAG: glycosyltransferase [Flavobacteriaceae bacterium]|nr:glycosyltransferase [Flavobacteriaceae bacterium]
MKHSVTLLYPFRNRDSLRIKNSLRSLALQEDQDFNVIFVDYGSEETTAAEVKEVVEQFSFVQYIYTYHKNQPWNKCKAINIALDQVATSHCFVSDVDMVYHPEFIKILKEQSYQSDVVYFQVGYLSFEEKIDVDNYSSIKPYRISNREATGLTLFNTEQLKSINGFDEYYHFWSSEDTDAHLRMNAAGFSVQYYDEKLLIKHQPHSTFRSRETTKLTKELRMTYATRFNMRRFLSTHNNGIGYIDQQRSKVISKSAFDALFVPDICIKSSNKEYDALYTIFEELNRFKGKIVRLEIFEDPEVNTFKFKIKRFLKKLGRSHATMKKINDILLLNVITNYRDKNYSIEIGDDLKTIVLSIDLR